MYPNQENVKKTRNQSFKSTIVLNIIFEPKHWFFSKPNQIGLIGKGKKVGYISKLKTVMC